MASLILAVFFGAFAILGILFNVAKHLSLRIEFRLQPINDVRVYAIFLLALLYFVLVGMSAYLIGRWKFFQGEASKIAGVKEHDWSKRKEEFITKLFKYAECFFIVSMCVAFCSFILTFVH